MAKFLIQDIMPPEKRKRTKTPSTPMSTEPEYVHHKGNQRQIDQDEPEEENDPYLRSEAVVSNDTFHEEEHITPPEYLGHPPIQESHSFEETELTPETEQFFSRISSRIPTSFSRPAALDGKFIFQGILGIVILAFCYIAYAEYFSGATITVTPKKNELVLTESMYRAQKDPDSSNLSFSVMEIELTETMTVPATGNKTVTEKASGRIVVYNEYSSASQRLIKNTRFQTPNGKIYRINESIVVPGYKKEAGKIIPGSIEVTVYADEPGPSYNSDPTDLTIPGLKSDAERFKGMYARSKTPLAGGKEGVIKSVSDADMKKAEEELTIALETKLRAKARGNLSGSQVIFNDGIVMNESDAVLVDNPTGDASTATVEKKGVLSAIVFDKDAVARAIAKKEIPGYQEEDVNIPQIESLTFRLDPDAKNDLSKAASIDFSLSGNASVIWEIDPTSITQSILGTEKRLFNNIMASQGTIENAEAKVFPFWHKSFPDEAEDIKIILAPLGEGIDE